MVQLDKSCTAVALLVCLAPAVLNGQTLRHEAQMWWKARLADTFQELRIGVDMPTEPVSVTLSLRIHFTIPAGDEMIGEPTLSYVEVSVDRGPVLHQDVDWTPTEDQRDVVIAMEFDTGGLADGWHRLEILGSFQDGPSQTKHVQLAASFETGDGDSFDSSVPEGPQALALLVDLAEDIQGVLDTKILSEVPSPLPSVWQPDIQGRGFLSVGGISGRLDPTLFVSFDDNPDGGEHTDVQVNEWPITAASVAPSLLPPDGQSWMYTRATLDTPSGALAAVISFAVGVSSSPPTDPPDDTDPPDPGGEPVPPDMALIPGQWYIAPGGTGNGSPSAPLGRIQAALDAAQPGDTISVASGTYHENLTTGRHGTANNRITLRSQDGRDSVEVIDAAGTNVLNVLHQHYLVTGFIFDGNSAETATVIVQSDGDHLQFVDNEVRRSGAACIDVRGPEGLIIERSVVHGCI